MGTPYALSGNLGFDATGTKGNLSFTATQTVNTGKVKLTKQVSFLAMWRSTSPPFLSPRACSCSRSAWRPCLRLLAGSAAP